MEFQLSELFAYLNTEISGAGQRGSDNRGWTVMNFFLLVHTSMERLYTSVMLPHVQLVLRLFVRHSAIHWYGDY